MVARRRERRTAAEPRRGIGQRQRRVGEELRHVLSKILHDGKCRDPALQDASITVTEVQISPDLRNANVFVMPLGGDNAPEIIAGLKRSAGFLKGLVAREVSLRQTPSLVFALDGSFDHADRISRLLAGPEIVPDLQAPPRQAEDADDAD
jgi:ribosome-binding factor A